MYPVNCTAEHLSKVVSEGTSKTKYLKFFHVLELASIPRGLNVFLGRKIFPLCTGFSSSSLLQAVEIPEWCLAFLRSSGRKILFNVSTITFPGVIYSGMLMCLESTSQYGLWHRLLWVFLSSIQSGAALALWCCCHLFKQQRLMQQESIDDPAVRQCGLSVCAQACPDAHPRSVRFCLCFASVWHCDVQQETEAV